MPTIHPYLNFPGNTEEAFNFYRSVFGGEFCRFMRFGDIPGGEQFPQDANRVMHVSLPVGDRTVMMASDSSDAMGQVVTPGNNFSLSLDTESREEADRYFAALGEGGEVTMPMDVMFWGNYFGMVRDRFGIRWMISCELPQEPAQAG